MLYSIYSNFLFYFFNFLRRYLSIRGHTCETGNKVVEVLTLKIGKHGHAKCHFVGIDVFNRKKYDDIVASSHNYDIPHVTRTDYQLIDISEDGFVSLLTESDGTKDDLRLPTDDAVLTQIVFSIYTLIGIIILIIILVKLLQ
ncbi:hypothetical protein UlMin_019349 [Ulmus minor]